MALPAQPGRLLYLFIPGTERADYALRRLFPTSAQDVPHLVRRVGVPAVLLRDKQHTGTKPRQKTGQILPHTAAAKEELGPVFKEKIVHGTPLDPTPCGGDSFCASIIKKSRLPQKSRKVMQYIPLCYNSYTVLIALRSRFTVADGLGEWKRPKGTV